MKKSTSFLRVLLLSASLLMLFFLSTGMRNSAPPSLCNDNHARAVAMSNQDFHDCIQPWQNLNFWDLDVSVYSTNDGTTCSYEVSAVACPRCQPNQACSKIACRIVAVALVDDDFNIVSVTCN